MCLTRWDTWHTLGHWTTWNPESLRASIGGTSSARGVALCLEGHVISDQHQHGVRISMADVVKRFGSRYRARFGLRLPWSHSKAMDAIENCRTPALGGHVLECNDCALQDYAYHSCRHRSCPKCMRDDAQNWIKARMEEALPVPHFHVVFNVPQRIQRLLRKHKQLLYPVTMRAAALALLEIGADRAYLGGEVGLLTTLHTWSRTLIYHPHVHCLVTAGCLDTQGRWKPALKPRLAPEEVLAERFRSHLLDLITKALDRAPVPSADPLSSWPVFVELATHGTEAVLRYLAKTLYSGPFSEHQLDTLTDSGVVFHYHDRNDGRRRKVQLEGGEFLRRFLQHVWPSGIHRVQYHGLWSRKSRPKLQALKAQLARQPMLPELDSAATAPDTETITTSPWLQCPHCGGLRTVRSSFTRNELRPVLNRPALHIAPPPTARPP